MGKARRLREQREREVAVESSPYPPDARSFALKMHRAKAHIDDLADSVETWLGSDAYTISEEVEPQTGDHVLRAHITKPLDPGWPLTVGDAVHNLRSALDHIAYQIALDGYQAQHPNGTIPLGHQRRIMFPIVAASNDPKLSVDEFYRQVIKGQLRYVPPDPAAVIETLQPYKRSPDDPARDLLWVVNELDVIDKHRKLTSAAVANPLRSMQVTGGDVHIKKLHMGGEPVENDREVMRWNIEAMTATPVQINRQFSRHIALTEGPQLAHLVGLLRACYADINESVVPALAAFL